MSVRGMPARRCWKLLRGVREVVGGFWIQSSLSQIILGDPFSAGPLRSCGNHVASVESRAVAVLSFNDTHVYT